MFVQNEMLKDLAVIEVRRPALIAHVMEANAKEGFPMNERWLDFQGRYLAGTQTLPNFPVTEIPTLLIRGNANEILVKTFTGKHITLKVDLMDKIEQINEVIQGNEEIPYEKQRLIFQGRQFELGRTLSDYGIKADSTLQLIPSVQRIRSFV
jgi:ubiquitin